MMPSVSPRQLAPISFGMKARANFEPQNDAERKDVQRFIDLAELIPSPKLACALLMRYTGNAAEPYQVGIEIEGTDRMDKGETFRRDYLDKDGQVVINIIKRTLTRLQAHL